jgi:general stress protein 26
MDPAAERHRVRDLLQQSEVAMLLTFGSGEAHAGRPMLPLWLPEDPNIYFLTHRESRKVAQVNERPHVALTVINAGCYLVVLGLAYASQDPALIRRLWRPSYRAWFPEGSDDREATVLRMVINKVNYWEPPRSRVRRLFQAVTAVVTRQPVETPMRTIDPW